MSTHTPNFFTEVKHKRKYRLLNLNSILSPEEVKEIVDIAGKIINENLPQIVSKEFFTREDGSLAENVPLFPNNEDSAKWNNLTTIINQRLELPEVLEVFPKLRNSDGIEMAWKGLLTLSSGKELGPHTDDLEKAYADYKEHGGPVTRGIYKGLIYLNCEGEDYSNLGTKFYTPLTAEDGIDTPYRWSHYVKVKNDFEKVKNDFEVPFIPGNGFIFETTTDSYHGTEYKGKEVNNRLTITLEYW